MEPVSLSHSPDVQNRAPSVQLSLSRVGVTGVEKVIRIGAPGAEQLFHAKLDCFVDLGPHQKGAHMSRFEEVVNEAIGEIVVGGSAFRAEDLATAVAEMVRDRQGALRAEVTIAARYPEDKPAPVSGITTQSASQSTESADFSANSSAVRVPGSVDCRGNLRRDAIVTSGE